MSEPIVERYKEIITSGVYGRVRYRDLRGVVTESDIRFFDIDGNVVGLINPDEDGLYGIYDERFFDLINEAVHDIASDPDAYLD